MKKNILILLALTILSCQKDKNDKEKIEQKNVTENQQEITKTEDVKIEAFESKSKFFWDYFKENEDKIYNFDKLSKDEQQKIWRQIHIRLSVINEALRVEISAVPKNGKRELIITANGLVDLFPAVRKLAANAPKMEKWIVKPFKQRMKKVRIRMSSGIDMSSDDLYFKIDSKKEKILNISVYMKGYEKIPENRRREILYQLLDGILGEEDVETYLGAIEDSDKKDDSYINSDRLIEEVDKLKK